MVATRPLEELKAEIDRLSPADKVLVIQWAARGLESTYTGIEHYPDVLGGTAVVANTRIPVWTLVRFRQLGSTDAEILEDYPTLTASELANAFAYAVANRDEIERDIRENDEAE